MRLKKISSLVVSQGMSISAGLIAFESFNDGDWSIFFLSLIILFFWILLAFIDNLKEEKYNGNK